MGNHCARSDHDESSTKTLFAVGPDYQELKNQFEGEGIKKTPAWQASITRAQLQRKREEFWKSRTTGSRRVWITLRAAVETDHLTAATILESSEIQVVGGSITRCKDIDGHIYEVPVFVVNNPVEFFSKRPKKPPKPKPPIESVVAIKLRQPGKPEDCALEVETSKTVGELKALYAEQEAVNAEAVRLFYCGRELQDAQTLASYELRSQVVVQVFAKPLQAS